MEKAKLFLLITFLGCITLNAQDKTRDSIIFSSDETSFSDYPGLTFRISEPYLRYQKWDTEHTGQAWFSLALELTNNSKQALSALNFKVVLYDKSGKKVYEATSTTDPMTFEPKDGKVLKPGYRGVYDAFISRDKSFYKDYGKLDFSFTEIKTASKPLNDQPVFSENWLSFDGHKGLNFQLSKPYTLIDDLSGNERFAIAIKFKNSSGNPVKFIYFNVKIYDDQGPLYENEVQEHNQKYDPPPKKFINPNFPVDYEGIDKKFYTNEKSLFKNFKKIEIEIVKVE